MMKKYFAIAAASLIGLAGIAAAAENMAHHNARSDKAERAMHKKGELPRDLQALNLNSKQKADIQKIIETHRADTKRDRTSNEAFRAEFRKKMQEYRAAEQQLISAKTFDETAARRMIAEHNQHHTDKEVQRLKTRHAVFQVLTPSQQKQWLDNQNKRMEKRGKKPHQNENHSRKTAPQQ
ncbi:Spy/CpxP family protein refolding chaperone [Neisseria animalis]|uniref:Periplasmic heavy metal sensor n=1 Tax=Neisseria animalis TaxID=492 RepID=A0A5P3MQC9_NEIAN|nr:Spy/CpxP family protein refolding chaperone [Neisseria animalis]QEY23776.1 hypothetical protein D0T90_04060 [Neisseria animalis]ROW31625.1 hypothetical protein CGZ60_09335 [Neisseria animalis]VEE09690.1 Spheroplast protein Y precursor [Neisseria animalis]